MQRSANGGGSGGIRARGLRRFNALSRLAVAAAMGGAWLGGGGVAFGFLYWDTNGVSAGAGTGSGGAWTNNASDLFWNTNSGGGGFLITSPWVSFETAVFSAGTDATGTFSVPVVGTVSVQGIVFEEGTVSLISGGSGQIFLSGTLPVDASGAASARIDIPIIGSGGLNKTGTNTVTLGNANNYSGFTTISAGTLVIDTFGTLPGNVTNNGTLRFNGPLVTTTLSGSIFGSGNVVVSGSTLTLSGNNSYTGGTTITGNGLLVATNSNSLGSGGATLGGGTLRLAYGSPSSLFSSDAVLMTAPSTIEVTNGNEIRMGGALDGGGNVLTVSSPNGGGTLAQLAGSVTNVPTITVTNGACLMSYTSNGWGGTIVTPGSGATLDIRNGGIVQVASGVTLPNPITFLNANVTAAAVGNGGTLSGPVTLNSTTAVGGSGSALTFSGNVGGTGGLTKTGAGFVALSGSNSYSGQTTVSSGTLIAKNAGALGSGNVTLNGGILQMDFTNFFMFGSRTVNQSAASKVSITTGNQVNHAGTFNGGGFALTVGGGGTWFLGQLGNTVTNIPSISVIENSSLGDANNPNGWGGATVSVANGSSVQVFGGVSVNNPLVLSGTTTGNGAVFNSGNGGATFGGAISLAQTSGVGGSFDYLVTGNISGTGGLVKLGASTITLSGSANSYTGSTSVSAGKLLVASNLTSTTSVAISGGTLELAAGGGSNRLIKTSSLSITGSGKLDLKDNKLIVTSAGAAGTWNGTTYTGVTQLIALGRNGSTLPLWDGSSGIVTSQTQATAGNLHSIGVARASDVRPTSATITVLWAGQAITGTDTLVMYTYGGDANLDGKINVDDYIRIDSGIAAGLTGWSNGDFNYDGKVNIDDYTTIIDANIGNQSGIFPTAGGVEGVVAIPEPAACGVLLSGAVWASARRRARRQRLVLLM